MSTVVVPRSDVTADEVCALLRDRLPSRYTITPGMTSRGFAKQMPDDANALLVRGSWLARANVRIIAGVESTEIDVSPGATYPGLIRLGDRVGIVRKVLHALGDCGDLT
ncbi:MAG: hypothetical protein ACLP8S_23025 [Solirubrobacteraceae bacterium]